MFDKHIKEFNENILSLRDFVDLIEPLLVQNHKEHNDKLEPIYELGVITQKLKSDNLQEEEKEELLKQKEALEQKIEEIHKGKISLSIKETNSNGNDSKGFKILTTNPIALVSVFKDARISSNHIELLYKNSLISLLSSVEWFFAQILHYHYSQYPDSAGIKGKTLTLAELKNFQTVQDAEKYLIEDKIEELLRGNFESWINLLQKELKLSLAYIKPHQDELIEIYQRRNLLVHNGGVVNAIYLSKVNADLRKDIKINNPLTVDKEYLDNAICKLHLILILIGAELWKQIDSEDKKRGDILTDIVYENLLKNRWEISEGLSLFLLQDSKMDPSDKVIAQLNNWLCRKRLGKRDEVHNELQSIDYSDKKELFQLGLYALKEDKKSFFKLLPIALDAKQLDSKSVEEFPIFEEMRITEEYEKFKSESEHFKKSNQSDNSNDMN